MDEDESVGFSEPDADRIARAVLWYERQERNRKSERSNLPAATEHYGPLFYNDSGEVIPPFAVMKHDSGVTDTATNEAWVKVKKPDTTYGNYLINGSEEIPVGGIGRAQDCRYGTLKYDTGSPVKNEGYGPKPGQWTASKGYPCLAISQQIEYAAAKYMQVEFLPITTLLGQTTGSVSGGSSTTSYRIYGGTAGSEADLGFTTVPTAYNRTATTIASGKWCQLEWINNTWYILPWEC